MRRDSDAFDFETAVERALRESGAERETVESDPRAIPLDGLRMRGIPAIGGRGSVGGAILGSRPDTAVLRMGEAPALSDEEWSARERERLERRRRRALIRHYGRGAEPG